MEINADWLLVGLVYLRSELQYKQEAGAIEPHEVEQLAELMKEDGELNKRIADLRARKESARV